MPEAAGGSACAVLLLSLAAFASAAALRASDPLLPLIAASFGTTPGGASAVITGFALAYGLLQLVTGPIADRIGKYRMVCWVTAVSAVGNLLPSDRDWLQDIDDTNSLTERHAAHARCLNCHLTRKAEKRKGGP